LPGNRRGAPVEEVSPKIDFYGRAHVIAYRATLDVPGELARSVAKLLAAEWRRRGAPRGLGALDGAGAGRSPPGYTVNPS